MPSRSSTPLYTRDDRRDRKIWKERLIESRAMNSTILNHGDNTFYDGRNLLIPVVNKDGMSVLIDLRNTKSDVKQKAPTNLHKGEHLWL